jgi:hypothetical protein
MPIQFSEQITSIFNSDELESIQQAISKISKLQAEARKPFLSQVEFQSLCKSIGEGVSPYSFINNNEDQSFILAECAILDLDTVYTQYCSELTQVELSFGYPSSIQSAKMKEIADQNLKDLHDLRSKEAQERLEDKRNRSDEIDRLAIVISTQFFNTEIGGHYLTPKEKLFMLAEACEVPDDVRKDIKDRVLQKLGRANRIKYGFEERKIKIASFQDTKERELIRDQLSASEYKLIADWLEENYNLIYEFVKKIGFYDNLTFF